MVLGFLYQHVWAAVALWLLVYAADHALTIRGATEFRRGPAERLVFEGSYELNPAFQEDVDALRLYGRPFWRIGALYSSAIVLAWWQSPNVLGGSEFFFLVLGGCILSNMTMVLGHISAIASYRALARGGAYEGRMQYSRRYLERQAGVSAMGFALLYLLIAALLQSWLMLGGAIACGYYGWGAYFIGFRTRRKGEATLAESVQGNLHPASWHPDPTKRHGYRYWDGAKWTDHVADDGAAAVDPYRA